MTAKRLSVLICCLVLFPALLTAPALAAPELPDGSISIGHGSDVLIVAPGGELVTWGPDELGFMWLCGFDYESANSRDYASRMTILPGGVWAVNGTYSNALVLMDDGTLYGLGHPFMNSFAGMEPANYQLYGYGLYNSGSLYPIKIMEDVVMVSGSFDLFSALKTDGSVWLWGRDNAGEFFGPIKYVENCRFTATTFFITDSGELYELTSPSSGLPDYADFRPVCSGAFAISGSLMQMENGDAYNFRDYLDASRSGAELPQPVAHSVKQLCDAGYITESDELYYFNSYDNSSTRLLGNVDRALCWDSFYVAITHDGELYASTDEGLAHESFSLLGTLDELAPEFEAHPSPWPLIMRAEAALPTLLPLLPLLIAV
jgi:hypothetical protein